MGYSRGHGLGSRVARGCRDVALAPGTLYRLLGRLCTDGLIAEIDRAEIDGHPPRGGGGAPRPPPPPRRWPLYSPKLVTCVVRLPPCSVHSNMALHSCDGKSSSTALQNAGCPASLGLAPLCRSKQPRLLLRLQPAAKALVLGRKLRDAALVLAGRARPPRPARVARGVLQCHAFTIARR